jgi:hypothetical protein
MNEIKFLRDTLGSTIWDVLYHEHELVRAHKYKAVTHGLFVRCDFTNLNLTEVEKNWEEYVDDDEDAPDSLTLVRSIVAQGFSGIDYHENALKEAHERLAGAKALLLRVNFPEVNFDEVYKEQLKKLEEMQKRRNEKT